MGKSAAPAAPDYIGQANATAAGNLEAARAQTAANRVDQVTPYGTLKYTNGQTFDSAGYDAAQKQYQQSLSDYNSRLAAGEWVGNTGFATPTTVNKDDFYSGNPDQWSSSIELSDTGQKLLDSANSTQLGLAGLQSDAMGRVADAQSQPFDTSGLIDINSKTGMDAWDKATDLIRQRQNPQLDAQQSALDTKLANQGLTAGSEGWGIQQKQFGQTRADADIAAQIAGLQAQGQFFNQGIQGNQATLQQRAFLRQQPLNELNALRTGAQVTNPTFASVPTQGQTQGADLLGATNQQYQSALGNVNAQNAQAAGTTNAAIGAAGSATAAYLAAGASFF